MNMNVQQAQSAVSLSAFVVALMYGYRKLVEPKPTSAPTGHFVIGFGVVYIALSLVAQAAPPVGGTMAILIAVGDFLTNGTALATDIAGVLGSSTGAATATAPATRVATTTTPAP